MKTLLIFSIVSFTFGLGSSSLCFWNVGCPYKYFSSKTSYSAIRGDIRDSFTKLEGCEPISIWALIRHGKRYPGPLWIDPVKQALAIRDYVVDNYEAGRSSLCAQDVDNLRNWAADKEMFENLNGLTNEGHIDLKGMGERLIQTFPKLLRDLKEDDYRIFPVPGQLMEDSAKALIIGLNNNNRSLTYHVRDDGVANLYENCKYYLKEVRWNDKTYEEAHKYKDNVEYLAMKDRIKRRSGVFNLTESNITALYDLCRYSSSGYENTLSPWCALFTTEDLKVLEYEGDLRHYYRNGYGHRMNMMMGRFPLTDLFKTFAHAKEGNGKKFTAHISHATMLDMVFSALGLFKDEKPLTYAYTDPNRKWRSCKMSSFSSNFVAVLNRCSLNEVNEHKVVFYHNEEPLTSICERGVCSFQEFEEKLTFENMTLDFCNIAD